MEHNIIISDLMLEDIVAFSANVSQHSFDKYIILKGYFSMYGVKNIRPAFINNFKDALMHFKKIESFYQDSVSNKDTTQASKSSLKVIIQYELFMEHMNRAIIDLYIELLQYVGMMLEGLYKKILRDINVDPSKSKYTTYAMELRQKMHYCKNTLLKLRTSKLSIERMIDFDFGFESIAYNQQFLEFQAQTDVFVYDVYQFLLAHNHDEWLKEPFDRVILAFQKVSSTT